MQRAEYLDLLRQCDDPIYGEWPGGWDASYYLAAEQKFLALAKEAQQIIGETCTIEYGNLIQDASFHGLLELPKSCLLQDYIVTLRVSNFGNLATLYDVEEVVKIGWLDIVKETLKRHGYTYIPSWILGEPYSGTHPGVTVIKNWVFAISITYKGDMMTLTIDVSPETESWLSEEAQKRGQEREIVAKLALEVFSARQREEEAERALGKDWQALSYRSLWEIWDNEEDAIYDKL